MSAFSAEGSTYSSNCIHCDTFLFYIELANDKNVSDKFNHNSVELKNLLEMDIWCDRLGGGNVWEN